MEEETKEPGQSPRIPGERQLESLLWGSRLLVMLAVVPSLLGATVLLLIGTADILKVMVDTASITWSAARRTFTTRWCLASSWRWISIWSPSCC